MSGEALANLAYVAVILALAGLLAWLLRDEEPPAEEWVYTGPDSLRLLEDLEAHMKAYGAAVADLYDTTTGDR